MYSIEPEHREEHDEEMFADNSLPLGSSGTYDYYGDPLIPPRVGDCHQVEIPSLTTELDHLQLTPTLNTDRMLTDDTYTRTGLTIPIMWVHHEDEFHEKGPVDSRNDERSHRDANCTIGSGNLLERGKCYRPLPELPATPWSDAAAKTFLLGLYIFGKNLVQVRNFVECKQMGDVLSYYYGTFYRSDAHRRWAECRKMRSRKCIRGQRIFTSWRQQELLSRVLPTVSKDVQDSVHEATKAFNEGRYTLEEYVLILKSAVGADALVEAVGIGKGKHDLTGVITDPVRTNRVSTRPEIPVGKACSALTSGDIIKLLKGDFRLSKARSNDLFWEAVWPRLLARGWHSEQPKDLAFKHTLVFLVPRVKRFSKKRLVKGNHYFDSVCDVLNKVAEDPMLLELEAEGVKEINDGEDEGHGHRYLRPRLCSGSGHAMFTIVDTSLVRGEPPFQVRELRSLPADAAFSPGHSATSGGSTSESSEEVRDSVDTSLGSQGELENGEVKGIQSDSHSKRRNPVNGFFPNDILNGTKPEKGLKHQFGRRVKLKSGHQDESVPLPGRRRLNPCDRERTVQKANSSPNVSELKKEEACCESELQPVDAEVLSSRAIPFPKQTVQKTTKQTVQKTHSSPNVSELKKEEACCESGPEPVDAEVLSSRAIPFTKATSKALPRPMIDLNLPFSMDFDATDSCMEMEGICHDSRLDESRDPQQHGGPQTSEAPEVMMEDQKSSMVEDQKSSMVTRRQGTRNRPLTARVLEAVACGYLGVKKKGRRTKSKSPPLTRRRRARRTTEAPTPACETNPAPHSSDHISYDVGIGIDEFCNNNDNGPESLISKSQVQYQRKRSHELLGVL